MMTEEKNQSSAEGCLQGEELRQKAAEFAERMHKKQSEEEKEVGKSKFEERTKAVFDGWAFLRQQLDPKPVENFSILFDIIYLATAKFILSGDWYGALTANNYKDGERLKDGLLKALAAIKEELPYEFATERRCCVVLEPLAQANPYDGVEYVADIIQSNDVSQEKVASAVAKLFEKENLILVDLRLESLCNAKCWIQAIKLTEACYVNSCWLGDDLDPKEKSAREHFRCNLKDFFYLLLCCRYKYPEAQSRIQNYLLVPAAVDIVSRLGSSDNCAKVASKWKEWKKACRTITSATVKIFMSQSGENVDIDLAKKVFRLWVKHSKSSEDDKKKPRGEDKGKEDDEIRPKKELLDKIDKISTEYVYALADVLYDDFPTVPMAIPSAIELYFRGMSQDINQIAKVEVAEAEADEDEEKAQQRVEAETLKKELQTKLSERYLRLANVFSHDPKQSWELTLTAFSLSPTEQLLQKLFHSDDFNSNPSEGFQLTNALKEDLITLTTNPRRKNLCWEKDKNKLEELCRDHLHTGGPKIKGKKDLKNLEIDFENYKPDPRNMEEEELDTGFEPGYEPNYIKRMFPHLKKKIRRKPAVNRQPVQKRGRGRPRIHPQQNRPALKLKPYNFQRSPKLTKRKESKGKVEYDRPHYVRKAPPAVAVKSKTYKSLNLNRRVIKLGSHLQSPRRPVPLHAEENNEENIDSDKFHRVTTEQVIQLDRYNAVKNKELYSSSFNGEFLEGDLNFCLSPTRSTDMNAFVQKCLTELPKQLPLPCTSPLVKLTPLPGHIVSDHAKSYALDMVIDLVQEGVKSITAAFKDESASEITTEVMTEVVRKEARKQRARRPKFTSYVPVPKVDTRPAPKSIVDRRRKKFIEEYSENTKENIHIKSQALGLEVKDGKLVRAFPVPSIYQPITDVNSCNGNVSESVKLENSLVPVMKFDDLIVLHARSLARGTNSAPSSPASENLCRDMVLYEGKEDVPSNRALILDIIRHVYSDHPSLQSSESASPSALSEPEKEDDDEELDEIPLSKRCSDAHLNGKPKSRQKGWVQRTSLRSKRSSSNEEIEGKAHVKRGSRGTEKTPAPYVQPICETDSVALENHAGFQSEKMFLNETAGLFEELIEDLNFVSPVGVGVEDWNPTFDDPLAGIPDHQLPDLPWQPAPVTKDDTVKLRQNEEDSRTLSTSDQGTSSQGMKSPVSDPDASGASSSTEKVMRKRFKKHPVVQLERLEPQTIELIKQKLKGSSVSDDTRSLSGEQSLSETESLSAKLSPSARKSDVSDSTDSGRRSSSGRKRKPPKRTPEDYAVAVPGTSRNKPKVSASSDEEVEPEKSTSRNRKKPTPSSAKVGKRARSRKKRKRIASDSYDTESSIETVTIDDSESDPLTPAGPIEPDDSMTLEDDLEPEERIPAAPLSPTPVPVERTWQKLEIQSDQMESHDDNESEDPLLVEGDLFEAHYESEEAGAVDSSGYDEERIMQQPQIAVTFREETFNGRDMIVVECENSSGDDERGRSEVVDPDSLGSHLENSEENNSSDGLLIGEPSSPDFLHHLDPHRNGEINEVVETVSADFVVNGDEASVSPSVFGISKHNGNDEDAECGNDNSVEVIGGTSVICDSVSETNSDAKNVVTIPDDDAAIIGDTVSVVPQVCSASEGEEFHRKAFGNQVTGSVENNVEHLQFSSWKSKSVEAEENCGSEEPIFDAGGFISSDADRDLIPVGKFNMESPERPQESDESDEVQVPLSERDNSSPIPEHEVCQKIIEAEVESPTQQWINGLDEPLNLCDESAENSPDQTVLNGNGAQTKDELSYGFGLSNTSVNLSVATVTGDQSNETEKRDVSAGESPGSQSLVLETCSIDSFYTAETESKVSSFTCEGSDSVNAQESGDRGIRDEPVLRDDSAQSTAVNDQEFGDSSIRDEPVIRDGSPQSTTVNDHEETSLTSENEVVPSDNDFEDATTVSISATLENTEEPLVNQNDSEVKEDGISLPTFVTLPEVSIPSFSGVQQEVEISVDIASEDVPPVVLEIVPAVDSSRGQSSDCSSSWEPCVGMKSDENSGSNETVSRSLRKRKSKAKRRSAVVDEFMLNHYRDKLSTRKTDHSAELDQPSLVLPLVNNVASGTQGVMVPLADIAMISEERQRPNTEAYYDVDIFEHENVLLCTVNDAQEEDTSDVTSKLSDSPLTRCTNVTTPSPASCETNLNSAVVQVEEAIRVDLTLEDTGNNEALVHDPVVTSGEHLCKTPPSDVLLEANDPLKLNEYLRDDGEVQCVAEETVSDAENIVVELYDSPCEDTELQGPSTSKDNGDEELLREADGNNVGLEIPGTQAAAEEVSTCSEEPHIHHEETIGEEKGDSLTKSPVRANSDSSLDADAEVKEILDIPDKTDPASKLTNKLQISPDITSLPTSTRARVVRKNSVPSVNIYQPRQSKRSITQSKKYSLDIFEVPTISASLYAPARAGRAESSGSRKNETTEDVHTRFRSGRKKFNTTNNVGSAASFKGAAEINGDRKINRRNDTSVRRKASTDSSQKDSAGVTAKGSKSVRKQTNVETKAEAKIHQELSTILTQGLSEAQADPSSQKQLKEGAGKSKKSRKRKAAFSKAGRKRRKAASKEPQLELQSPGNLHDEVTYVEVPAAQEATVVGDSEADFPEKPCTFLPDDDVEKGQINENCTDDVLAKNLPCLYTCPEFVAADVDEDFSSDIKPALCVSLPENTEMGSGKRLPHLYKCPEFVADEFEADSISDTKPVVETIPEASTKHPYVADTNCMPMPVLTPCPTLCSSVSLPVIYAGAGGNNTAISAHQIVQQVTVNIETVDIADLDSDTVFCSQENGDSNAKAPVLGPPLSETSVVPQQSIEMAPVAVSFIADQSADYKKAVDPSPLLLVEANGTSVEDSSVAIQHESSTQLGSDEGNRQPTKRAKKSKGQKVAANAGKSTRKSRNKRTKSPLSEPMSPSVPCNDLDDIPATFLPPSTSSKQTELQEASLQNEDQKFQKPLSAQAKALLKKTCDFQIGLVDCIKKGKPEHQESVSATASWVSQLTTTPVDSIEQVSSPKRKKLGRAKKIHPKKVVEKVPMKKKFTKNSSKMQPWQTTETDPPTASATNEKFRHSQPVITIERVIVENGPEAPDGPGSQIRSRKRKLSNKGGAGSPNKGRRTAVQEDKSDEVAAECQFDDDQALSGTSSPPPTLSEYECDAGTYSDRGSSPPLLEPAVS